jgi:peroxiredoxin
MKAVGEMAPVFSAPSSLGEVFQLQEALGQGSVVLYFYLRDFTPG